MNHPTAGIYGNFPFRVRARGTDFHRKEAGLGDVVMACDLEAIIAFF
jgi:hypothetical protein